MDTLLASADNLDDLLDELEKNEGEPVKSVKANHFGTGDSKSTSTTHSSTIGDQSRVIFTNSPRMYDDNGGDVGSMESYGRSSENNYPYSTERSNGTGTAEEYILDKNVAVTQPQTMQNPVEVVTSSESHPNPMDLLSALSNMSVGPGTEEPKKDDSSLPDTHISLFGALPTSTLKSDVEGTRKNDLNQRDAVQLGAVSDSCVPETSSNVDLNRANSDVLVNLFGAVPSTPVKPEPVEETPTMLFSPLNPFSLSYAGPITTYEGDNFFPEIATVNNNNVQSTEQSNPFAVNEIETPSDKEAIAEPMNLKSQSQEQLLKDSLNNTYVQSLDKHKHSLSCPLDTPGSEMQTDELQQQNLPSVYIDSNARDLTLSVDLQPKQSVNVSPNIATQSIVEHGTTIGSKPHTANEMSSSQTGRQESSSMGFMRDVEISKEEFDRFWEQVEDESDGKSDHNESSKNDFSSTVKPALSHDGTPINSSLSLSLMPDTKLDAAPQVCTEVLPSLRDSDVLNAHSETNNISAGLDSDTQVAHRQASGSSVDPPTPVPAPSTPVYKPEDSSENTSSTETIVAPVSVPFMPDTAVSRGSPTFPLRRKPQANQVDVSSGERVQNEQNQLSLNVDVPAEENSDVQLCYPATPPPPYSEEMHANYERSVSPSSVGAPDQPLGGQSQLQQEREEDASLLAIMETITRPGETKPVWIPDQDAPQCSNCAQKFTFTRRRHHCRACGRVFCANCCSERSQLKYMDYKEARVCLMCNLAIKQADAVAAQISERRLRSRVINNVPSAAQEVVHPVPVGEEGGRESAENAPQAEATQNPTASASVQAEANTPRGGDAVPTPEDAEIAGATAGATTVKSVRFSDGTRPTHPDETPTTPPPPTRTNRLRKRHGAVIDQTSFNSTTLPPVVIAHGEDGTFAVQNDPDCNVVLGLLECGNKNPQTFVLNPNLFVHVKFVSYVNRQCWCYWSEGMDFVGQREIILVLERQGLGDRQISTDAFTFFKHIFDRARKGKIFNTSDYMPKSVMGMEEDGKIFELERNAGFLFVQATSQSVDGLSCLTRRLYSHSDNAEDSRIDQPIEGMLFAILVQKTEAPLATLFPLRLMLRLGIESKQYPCPLFSIRQRDPVFQEIGHTILAILCDFNNFKYRIIGVPGIRVILSTDGHISVQIPCNRFRDTVRIMNSSNESVLAIGTGTYGPRLTGVDSNLPADGPCDSHLVCVQDQENTSYHTEISCMKNVKALNTGAAFVIFNGSLKSDGSHLAKCAIVEDGVMIQLLPEKMEELRACLKSMEDFHVPLAVTTQSLPDQNSVETNQEEQQSFLEVKWVDDDKAFNIGMFSPIDGTPFEGIIGFNVQGRSEQKGKKYILRWNQVFFLASTGNPLDLSRLAEQIANGCFQAFTPVIQDLVKHGMRKIGVRVTIHPENVGYIAGGGQRDLPPSCMNSLDEHLIQTIHGAANSVPVEQEAIAFELLFSVLLTKPSYRTA